MKNKIITALLFTTALVANSEVDTISEFFSEATTKASIKYYYIQTDKENISSADTSANANSLGGKLSFDSASIYGFSSGVTFMTTNPFLLSGSVDTSIIGKDNGARSGDAKKGFSVLGEAYLAYNYGNMDISVGRKVIKTPLINAKVVRMLPSAVEGAFASYSLGKESKVEVAYLEKFKQRSSNEFTNVIKHALGANTQAIIGSNEGYVAMAGVDYKNKSYDIKLYDYYAKNFINSAYLEASYKISTSDMKLAFSSQYINQKSIGNADSNLAKSGSLTGAKQIDVNAFAMKGVATIKSAKFMLAYSKLLKNDSKHDSLVLPWDGTPLFTNMITSNNLFQSIYGSALKADSVYIGDSQGIKVAYNQKYDSFGLKGFSTTFAYLNTSNSRFAKNQNDYNLVLGYKYDKQLSLALKGIWVENSTGSNAVGMIAQTKLLSQYRVIANYKL